MRDWLWGGVRDRALARGAAARTSAAAPQTPLIRRADDGDVEAVARLLVATWHATYDAWLGRDAVVAVTREWHMPERLAREVRLDRAVFLVAVALEAKGEQRIVGTAFAYPRVEDCTDPDAARGAELGRSGEPRAGEHPAAASPDAEPEPETELATTVEIGRLYIAPENQRRGIGRALLAGVYEAYPGAQHFRLDVDPRNARAIAFYERQGFRVIDRGEDCGGSGLPHLVMQRTR